MPRARSSGITSMPAASPDSSIAAAPTPLSIFPRPPPALRLHSASTARALGSSGSIRTPPGSYLLSGGIYSTLDDPLAIGGGTTARGVNNAGQIVGSYTDGSGTHGFLRSGGIYTTLDHPFATNGTLGNSINDFDTVVGTYNTLRGTHPFLYCRGLFHHTHD